MQMMAPYADMVSGIIEAKTLQKRDAAMRKVGDVARRIAMGGGVVTAGRKVPAQGAAEAVTA